MATSNRCSVCHKEAGAIFCNGCNAHFCMKDLKGHREKLSAELDRVIEERDELQDKINKAIQHPNSVNQLIAQIDDWQKYMVRKVEQVAEQARKHVVEFSESKRMKLATEFNAFSQELVQKKETENFVEPDLIRLKQIVRQMDLELGQLCQPTTIKLNIEQTNHIAWDSLIYIEENFNNYNTTTASDKESTSDDIVFSKNLPCGGRVCAKCHVCREWYCDSNGGWRHRDGFTCRYNGPGFHDGYVCQCK